MPLGPLSREKFKLRQLRGICLGRGQDAVKLCGSEWEAKEVGLDE